MKAHSAFAFSLFACSLVCFIAPQPADSAGSAKEKSSASDSKRKKGESEAKGDRAAKADRAEKGDQSKARQQKEKQGKQAQVAKARKDKATEDTARRNRVAGAGSGAGEAGGEMAEDLGDVNEGPGGAKIVHHSHVLYLKDGTKMKGSILMHGAKSIIVLTEQGELELNPADIEQVAPAEEQAPPVYASTQIFEGHEYLTAPQVGEEESEEEAEEEVVEEKVEEEPKEEVEVKLPEAPLLESSVKPAEDEPINQVAEVIQQTVTPGMVKPKSPERPVTTGNQTKQEISGGDPAAVKATAMDSQRPRPGASKPAEVAQPAEIKKQGMSDLLKSLETKDGLNSVLEQLKSNPDFFKSFELNK